MKAELEAITQSVRNPLMSIQNLVAYFARISNETGSHRPDEELIKYLLKNDHVSPFDMCHVVLRVETSRDIARQFLRHRSFAFQEFSQRYSATETYADPREARLQDYKNRQNSLETDDEELKKWWSQAQLTVSEQAFGLYDVALKKGIAKEQARALLPEGLTMSRLFVSGSIRSWIFYTKVRTHLTTQKEHRELALACATEIEKVFPMIKEFVNND